MTNPTPQMTDFTRDIIGRYICNGLDEALRSTDSSLRADARPFNMVVIGGGTFGAALAQHLFHHDKLHQYRILVLEAGPFILPEHVQNMPMIGVGTAGDTSIATLRGMSADEQRRWSRDVWGIPWHSDKTFPGLAYCVGGRSLFWGGWSPQLLDGEMRTTSANGGLENVWPTEVVTALKAQTHGDSYFHQAAAQIGASESNDFIYGPLHESLRQRLYEGISANQVSGAIPLADLPLTLDIPDRIPAQQHNLWKLEAPLAVQSRTRTGFFPFNKFSSVPLLIKAVREAQHESNDDDVKKRVMVVPNCHVRRMITEAGRVVAVDTHLGTIPIPQHGQVVLALGTVESTRLAKLSFQDVPNADLIGQNLMAHLRSNLNIRIPRQSLTGIDATLKELQTSALFVKGQHQHSDGSLGYFHLQITASGLGMLDTDSEAELFKKVPDIDGFDAFESADDQSVVITVRGIGQMEALNPDSYVRLDPNLDTDEFGIPRAFVSIADPRQPGLPQSNPRSAKDLALWDTMDRAAEDVARIFAGTQPYEVLTKQGPVRVAAGALASSVVPASLRRDKLGTTHHETGSLWMGDNPLHSVTSSNCRFHHVANCYVLGPAVFPTIGSPNPMLTGVALARRLVDQLLTGIGQYTPTEASATALFDGVSTDNWRMTGPGNFIMADGMLETVPGNDIGLYWCKTPTPADFILKLEWMCSSAQDNSGICVRFPDPFSKGYMNPAYVPVHFGFEIQIDAQGAPDGAGMHKTGAIYGEDGQQLTLINARDPGQWNEYEIRVQGQHYSVKLNGAEVSRFDNTHAGRGLASGSVPSYIGLQAHTGRVMFRNIRILPL